MSSAKWWLFCLALNVLKYLKVLLASAARCASIPSLQTMLVCILQISGWFLTDVKLAKIIGWRTWCQLHDGPIILYLLLQVTSLERSETRGENGIYRQTGTLLHCKIISYMSNKQFHYNDVTLASDHRKLDCFLNRFFRLSSKKTPTPCEEKPQVTVGFPSQRGQ